MNTSVAQASALSSSYHQEPANDQLDVNSEYDKGLAYFNAIESYILQNTAYGCKMKADGAHVKGCFSIADKPEHDKTAREIFIRFDFYVAGSYGTPEYRIGVYEKEKATDAIQGDDKKLLLMNSQRGVNGFPERFEKFLERFTRQKPKSKLTLG